MWVAFIKSKVNKKWSCLKMNLSIGKILSHMWLFRYLFINWNIYGWDYYEWEIKLDVKKNVTNDDVARKCLKLIRSFFSYHTKKFRRQSFIKIERLSQELFLSDFQFHDSTKWWCYQWFGLNLSKPTLFLGTMRKESETKFPQIRITKSKVIHVQIPVSKWEKVGKKFGLHNGQ